MTIVPEGYGSEGEERRSGRDELSKLEFDILKLRTLFRMKALRLQLSNGERSQLSRESLNLSALESNFYKWSTWKDWQEKENVHHDGDCNSLVRDREDDGFEEIPLPMIGFTNGNRLSIDGNDEDNEVRPCFPCPFCNVDVEFHTLCNHMQEEHCFDFENAVCPLCAANLGKDATGHFMAHHGTSLKHRKKSAEYGSWSAFYSSMLNTNSSCGSTVNGGNGKAQGSPSEDFLTQFLGSLRSDSEGSHQVDSAHINASHLRSAEIYSFDGDKKLNYEERIQRATFVQQLITSAIL